MTPKIFTYLYTDLETTGVNYLQAKEKAIYPFEISLEIYNLYIIYYIILYTILQILQVKYVNLNTYKYLCIKGLW